MAQKIEVKVLSDLTGEEGAVTVPFGLDGVDYDIDLTDDEKDALVGALEAYIQAARKISGRAARKPSTDASRPTAPKGTSSADKELRTTIRRWARDNGIPVGDRGRIAEDVEAAYDAQDPSLAHHSRKEAGMPTPAEPDGEVDRDSSTSQAPWYTSFSG